MAIELLKSSAIKARLTRIMRPSTKWGQCPVAENGSTPDASLARSPRSTRIRSGEVWNWLPSAARVCHVQMTMPRSEETNPEHDRPHRGKIILLVNCNSSKWDTT
jgi:hypothetical protein